MAADQAAALEENGRSAQSKNPAPTPTQAPAELTPRPAPAASGSTITSAQRSRFWAIAFKGGEGNGAGKEGTLKKVKQILEALGIEEVDQIRVSSYDRAVKNLMDWSARRAS